MSKLYKYLIIVSVSLFVIFGYIDSDAVFYKKRVKLFGLNTPDDVFKYLNHSIHNRYSDSLIFYPSLHSIPTRDKMECDLGFWCDEGAIAMSKFIDYMDSPYKWRLVDVYGSDNISHHTVIQVFYEEKWKTYDIFFKTDTLSPDKTVKYKVPYVKYRKWDSSTKIYHFLIEHNSVIKYIALKLRNVY